MAYRDFTLAKAAHDFGLQVDRVPAFFAESPPLAPSAWLTESLRRTVPLALAIHTEKARSEFIVAPVLSELREQYQHRISLFSGVELNVDKSKKLKGFCDFIIGGTPQQLFLEQPLITVVEAKKDDLHSGLGQCAAEMVAAQLFNQNAEKPIYGVVTSGTNWLFLRLIQQKLLIDLHEYPLGDASGVLGILWGMVASFGAEKSAAQGG
jgi:hypothetical protein